MSSPTLTIITVVKNSCDTLEQAITSVINQKTPEIEYVVIDGGSTDGSTEIIEKYSNAIDYWHSKKDRGISDAFNLGIANAHGRFIGILNADDFYEPEILARVCSLLKSNEDIDVLHGSVRLHDQTNQLSYIERPDLSKIRRYMSIYHPTMFVRKTAYENVGLYSENFRFAMDSEWVHRAIVQGMIFFETDCVIANMRLQGASHKSLTRSLAEYRISSITNFDNRFEATYYFFRQLMIQHLLKIGVLKRQRLKAHSRRRA